MRRALLLSSLLLARPSFAAEPAAVLLSRQLMEAQEAEARAVWGVPYLPIDPKDVGRTYEAVIRVNSQSG